jgi:hypothetical protein
MGATGKAGGAEVYASRVAASIKRIESQAEMFERDKVQDNDLQ